MYIYIHMYIYKYTYILYRLALVTFSLVTFVFMVIKTVQICATHIAHIIAN